MISHFVISNLLYMVGNGEHYLWVFALPISIRSHYGHELMISSGAGIDLDSYFYIKGVHPIFYGTVNTLFCQRRCCRLLIKGLVLSIVIFWVPQAI